MNSIAPNRIASEARPYVRGRLAPRKMLLLVAILAIALSVAGAYAVLSAPWLGVGFSASTQPEGLRVESLQENSPNLDRLVEGMVLVALEAQDEHAIALAGNLIIEDPDLMSFADLRAFYSRQEAIDTMLKSGPVTAVTDAGQRIELGVASSPFRQLSYFGMHSFYGVVSLLIALSIWIYQPGQRSTQLFALSGASVFVNTVTIGAYGGRELAIDGQLFQILASLTHGATLMVCASLAGLFWVYPRSLGRSNVPLILLASALLLWIVDIAQIGGSARATIYLPVFVGYLAGLGFAAMQWRASSNRPLDRGAIKWCILAIFAGSFLLMGLLIIPPAFGGEALVPMVVGFSAYIILYLGIAMGLLRYRLFDLERWWFKTWLWFAGGALVIVLDLALVFGLGFAGEHALTLSLAFSGWLYFPLRQWIWRRMGEQEYVPLDAALRELVDKLFAAETEEQIRHAWPQLLQNSFAPLSQRQNGDGLKGVSASADGVRLAVPALPGDDKGLVVEFPANGGRLFTRQDVRIARLLYDLTGEAIRAVRAREAGAEVERNRIMRDLHDDLGARLLSLVYAAESEANRELARAGLKDLHDLIGTTARVPVPLRELVMACEGEVRSRLSNTQIALDWQVQSEMPDRKLSARAAANIARILREALSNVIRHAGASQVRICWDYPSSGLLQLLISDNGQSSEPQGWSGGNGLRIMRVRAKDLGGQVSWRRNASGGCSLQLDLPL